MALDVHCMYVCMFLSRSMQKKQREITTFCVFKTGPYGKFVMSIQTPALTYSA